MKKQAETFENPLVPHAVLQQMYAGMKALRALEPNAAALAAGGHSLRGEEACRASSLLSLGAGDLVSDVPGSAVRTQRRGAAVLETMAPGVLLLPSIAAAIERLSLAVGAASALRVQGESRLVLLYARAGEVSPAVWKQSFGTAGRRELPIIFLVLPRAGKQRSDRISDRAQNWGVPGMPVDAADAVALYRVMQESVLRARGGDGPALIECVSWQPAGAATQTVDVLKAMRRVLSVRGLLPVKARSHAVPQPK